jgi:hypothetical protein
LVFEQEVKSKTALEQFGLLAGKFFVFAFFLQLLLALFVLLIRCCIS